MSSLRRVVSVLPSPGKTFGELAERPTWAVALIVLLVVGGLVSTMAVQKIDTDGQRALVRERLEDRGLRGDELERQLDQTMSVMERIRPFFPVFGIFGMVLSYLLITLVLWGGMKLAGGETSWGGAWSTTLHGLMPQAVSALVSMPLLINRESIDPEAVQNGSLLASNPAFFLSDEASDVVRTLLASLDFFSIWSIVLLILGFSITARTSKGTSAAVVLTCWFFWIAAKTGWTALVG